MNIPILCSTLLPRQSGYCSSLSTHHSRQDSTRDAKAARNMLKVVLLAAPLAFIISVGSLVTRFSPVSAQILSPGTIASLQQGDEGVRVLALQEQLRDRGYFVTPDRVYGPETASAVRQFQRDQGLVVDGVYGPATEAALFGTGSVVLASSTHSVSSSSSSSGFGPYVNASPGSRTITLGDRGSDVLQLQQSLNRLGFNAGVEDGAFGNTTLAAVRSFQQSRGLSVDGVVGRSTWCALGFCTAQFPPSSFPPTSFPPTSFPPTSGGVVMTPLETILNQGRYVVVVPGSDTSNLFTIQNELGRTAYLTRSDRGSFTTPGGYTSFSAARSDALRLRGADLDARVEYCN
jgi:peptidoglycan hydrolase-like protein with peptidoglycan-binding domain